MNRRLTRALGVAVVAVLAIGAPAVAYAADADPADAGNEQTFTFPESASPERALGSDQNEVSARALAACVFNNRIDSIHYSSTGDGTLSVHGWWENVNCQATKANITVNLQKRNALGLWFDIGSRGVKLNAWSGGGSANRANSRYTCVAKGENNAYRAWVDVDLVGYIDSPTRYYTPEAVFPCD
jgi:hypothetical protein